MSRSARPISSPGSVAPSRWSWLLLSLLLAGCGPDQATRRASGQRQAPQAADSASAERLHAGLQVMRPRVLRAAAAYAEIEPTPEGRYFMHPAMERDALLVFNVGGLKGLTLSPRLSTLDPGCLRDPDAGVVAVAYRLDNGAWKSLAVDRTYVRTVSIDVRGAREFAVKVGHGNGSITCDWFGLGVMDVR